GCRHCAEARVSHLELRVAFARSAGEPHARTVPRPQLSGSTLAFWMVLSLLAGAAAGWLGHIRWGGPGPDSLESTRATFLAQYRARRGPHGAGSPADAARPRI